MKTDQLTTFGIPEPETAGVDPAEIEPRRAWDDFAFEEKPGIFRRHRVVVTIAGILLVGLLAYFWKDIFPKKKASAPRRDNIVVVSLPPPPPPPPVAPPPPPPPEEKMIEQTPVENESKPEEKADEPPPADLGTGIKGDGPPDGFGLTGRGGSGATGAGTGSAQQRSRWGWYASQVQSRIQQTVRTHRTTRAAAIRIDVKVWADSTGRITRATLANPTGNAALDAALRDEVLTGLQLSEPPPEGMPMPIVLRITARRPN
jgi:hypothetical protein